jgi:hypothetical protein
VFAVCNNPPAQKSLTPQGEGGSFEPFPPAPCQSCVVRPPRAAVTDVCDPKDCPTPFDVKVEPYKGRYLWYGSKGSRPRAPVYMYFVKCCEYEQGVGSLCDG